MVQAIGSSAASGAVSSGTAPAGLEAQLVRYQKLLSECVNCASSKTTEGKAEIQAISVKISEIKQSIEKVTEAGPSEQVAQLTTAASTAPNTLANKAAATEQSENATPISAAKSAYAAVGSRLDVLA